jgi:hypothetical protein
MAAGAGFSRNRMRFFSILARTLRKAGSSKENPAHIRLSSSVQVRIQWKCRNTPRLVGRVEGVKSGNDTSPHL